MNALLLLCLIGDTPQAPPVVAQAPPVKKAPIACPCSYGWGFGCTCKDKGCKCGDKCLCEKCPGKKPISSGHDYMASSERAVANNVPLVVGIGCDVPQGYYLSYRLSGAEWKQLFKDEKPGIWVAVPDGKGWMDWQAKLPPNADPGTITAWISMWLRRTSPARPTAGSAASNEALYFEQPRYTPATSSRSRSC